MDKFGEVKAFIFTALPCEAKPLTAFFKLKKDLNSHAFPVYSNADNGIALTVSGSGKTAMAAAVAYSLARFNPTVQPVLINIGIAGHKTAAVGGVFAADKITDAETLKHYYPQLIAPLPFAAQALQTVAKPQFEYQPDCLYDMEASGFYKIAAKFSTSELIHSFKIVSDNQANPITQINAAAVTEWITAQLELLEAAVQQVLNLADSLQTQQSPSYQAILSKWQFNVNTQLQLRHLLQRWDVLSAAEELNLTEIKANNSKEVLLWLEQKINSLPFRL
jgi:adenosylhomocysteine nucleosidase